MAGGVHQLRAMFEKVNESSSPERGRSGASSAVGSERSLTPLSKVRTSFIAVQGSRHRSLSIESTKLKSNSLTNGSEKRYKSTTIDNCSKNLDAADRPHNINPEIVDKKPGDCVRDDKIRKVEKISLNLPASTTSKALASNQQPMSDIKSPKISLLSDDNAAISTSSPARNLARTPNTPFQKRSNIKEIDITHSRTSTTSRINGNSSSKQSLSNPNSVNKRETQASLPSTRSKKLPPKSPTRPMKPPASPKTNSASSNLGTQKIASSIPNNSNLKRASKRIQPPTRSQSRMSTISSVSSVPKNHINKKSSSSYATEKSISQSPRQSLASQSSASDSNFLNRLMRPTTSSASKTADKSKSGTISTKSSTKPLTSSTVKSLPPRPESKMRRPFASTEKNPRASRNKNINSQSKILTQKQPTERISKLSKPNQKNGLSTSTTTDNGHVEASGPVHTETLPEIPVQPTKLTSEQTVVSCAPADSVKSVTSSPRAKDLDAAGSGHNKDLQIEKPTEGKAGEKLILLDADKRDAENGDIEQSTSFTIPPKIEENKVSVTSNLQYDVVKPETETYPIVEGKSSEEDNKGTKIPLDDKRCEDQATDEIRQCENTSIKMEEIRSDSLQLNYQIKSDSHYHEFSREVEEYCVTNPEKKHELVERQIYGLEVKLEDQRIKESGFDKALEIPPELDQGEYAGPISIGNSPIKTTSLVPKDLGAALSTSCLPLPSPTQFEEVISDSFPSPVSIKFQSTHMPGNMEGESVE